LALENVMLRDLSGSERGKHEIRVTGYEYLPRQQAIRLELPDGRKPVLTASSYEVSFGVTQDSRPELPEGLNDVYIKIHALKNHDMLFDGFLVYRPSEARP
jgi:hypothetical protein